MLLRFDFLFISSSKYDGFHLLLCEMLLLIDANGSNRFGIVDFLR